MKGVDAIETYFFATTQAIVSCTFDITDVGTHEENYYFRWVMKLTIKRDKDNPLEAPTTWAVPPASALGEINKRVAENFMATKLFSDTVKKGLKFFFSLRG